MLGSLIAASDPRIAFSILVVGSVSAAGKLDPFRALMDQFPSSRVTGIEIDVRQYDSLPPAPHPAIRFYSEAVGRANEKRTLYEATHGVHSSFYEPDERFADLFNTLDNMRLRSATEIRTVSLDSFIETRRIAPPDFIALELQGSELDVLQGGSQAVSSALAVLSHVSFVPLCKAQPLFGDVAAYLLERRFMLHSFLGFGGRVMKPLSHRGLPHYPVQMLWSHALFARDFMDATALDNTQLLKLAVLLDIYGSSDVALHLLREHDGRQGTQLADTYARMLLSTGAWENVTAEEGTSQG